MRVYAEAMDRPAKTYWEASDDCRNKGGRLATGRDIAELIRSGIPNGVKNDVWSSATIYTDTP